MACPKGSPTCEGQPSVDDDNDGCGAELTRWLKLVSRPVAPPKPGVKPPPEKRPITLDQLPTECRAVLASGTPPAVASPAPAKPEKAAPAKQPTKQPKPAPAAKQAKPAPKKASLTD
jgi:hypothetical protein